MEVQGIMRTNVQIEIFRFGDIRKNLVLKDRKYFVTLGFFCEH